MNAVAGIASGVNRQTPTINHRAPLRLSNKRYYWAIGTKSFFLDCTQHNSQRPLRNSFVADCCSFYPIPSGFPSNSKGLNMLWRYIFDQMSCNEMLQSSLFEPSEFSSWKRENKSAFLTIWVVQYGISHS